MRSHDDYSLFVVVGSRARPLISLVCQAVEHIQVLYQLGFVKISDRAPSATGETENPTFHENQETGPQTQNETSCDCQHNKRKVAIAK